MTADNNTCHRIKKFCWRSNPKSPGLLFWVFYFRRTEFSTVPKVLSTPFRAQVITLSMFSPPTGSQESLLCPVRALRVYIEHSASYKKSEQLFVGFGNRAKAGPVTKQRISRWLVDAITLAYSSSGLQCPIGVRAHSTRGIASSWAGWSSPSTFARFYNLGVPPCRPESFLLK